MFLLRGVEARGAAGGEPSKEEGRLFCTDRYGGGGRLFALGRGDLALLDSAALGAHPRYTAPLGSGADGLIFSASRDDGMLTALWAANLSVAFRRPAAVAEPSFVARWPPIRLHGSYHVVH